MAEFFETGKAWFMDLGGRYGVNPVMFGVLYLASIPPYLVSIGWIIRNYQKDRSLALPVLSTLFFFSAPAIYLLFSGKNVPWWFYGLIVAMILYGAYRTYRKIKRRVNKETQHNGFKIRI